jgi:hypothetical protein
MQRNALGDPQVPPDAKHKFGVMCLGALFFESVPVPPKHEKSCVDVSHLGHTDMHYMTRRSHLVLKHKTRYTELVCCIGRDLWVT